MGAPGRGKTELYSSWWYVAYATLAADKDLLADGPGGAGNGQPCRRIVPGGSGNIQVTRPDGAGSTTNITIPVIAGQVLDLQATKIIAAGTTCGSAVVYW